MNQKLLNTMVDFEFCDGSKTKLTLAFYLLYQLKAKNAKLYERYSKIMSKQRTEELESITVLYTAYVCAHISEENIMSEEEFMIMCGSDRVAVNNAAVKLMRPKKQ